MIHTVLLVFAVTVYVCSVTFLYLKDFLPNCIRFSTAVEGVGQIQNSKV